jgi:hypothetical protein
MAPNHKRADKASASNELLNNALDFNVQNHQESKQMKSLDLQQTSDFLHVATITETSEELGVTIAHRGTTPDGVPFVLVNNANGTSLLFT